MQFQPFLSVCASIVKLVIISDMSKSSNFVQVVRFCPNCQIASKLSDCFQIVRLFPNCQIVSKLSGRFQIVILFPNSQIVSKLSDRVSWNQNLSSMTHVCLYLRSMPIDGGLRERGRGRFVFQLPQQQYCADVQHRVFLFSPSLCTIRGKWGTNISLY